MRKADFCRRWLGKRVDSKSIVVTNISFNFISVKFLNLRWARCTRTHDVVTVVRLKSHVLDGPDGRVSLSKFDSIYGDFLRQSGAATSHTYGLRSPGNLVGDSGNMRLS